MNLLFSTLFSPLALLRPGIHSFSVVACPLIAIYNVNRTAAQSDPIVERIERIGFGLVYA